MSRAQQLKSGDVSLGLAHEWVCAFGRQGGTAAMLQESIEKSYLMRAFIGVLEAELVALENPIPPTVTNAGPGPVYDVRAVNKLFSLGYSDVRLFALDIPPQAIPGFLTLFDPGWSILRLRRFCADKGKMFSDQNWYDNEDFSKRGGTPRYRQIRLEALYGSFNKNFDDQQRLLPENEEVPSARGVVMGMVIHFLLSGQRLFENCYVRCADKVSGDRRVFVGSFDRDGLRVSGGYDDHRSSDLGLASSQKF